MIKWLYKNALKPVLFKFDPELVHDVFVDLGEFCGKSGIGRALIFLMFGYKGRSFTKTVDGINYHSPVSLAAGFDYNGRLTQILSSMAFGGVEIGSVTARPCEGNKKPRLRRLIKSNGLVVNKGLKNEGVDKIINRLKSLKRRKNSVLGISIAKTNDALNTTLENGIEDYGYSFKRLNEEGVGDFYTINISCPNVFGGENFAEPHRLRLLMEKLQTIPCQKPVYVKMPINLPWEEFNTLLEVLLDFNVHGLVIGNLNKKYEDAEFQDEVPRQYSGGLSGKPCRNLSTDLIRQTKEKYQNQLTIIGCGGILSAEDAKEKLDAGAELLQLITGMIFEGPHLMKDICEMYQKNPQYLKTKTPQKISEKVVKVI
ncbi:quinone-dependent dihydroorotate dehydrogenase [soil metagenome]